MKLKQAVDSINTTLQAALNFEKFQRGEYYGLAKLVKTFSEGDSQETTSIIYDDSGNEIKCTVDDIYSFQIYHRCLKIAPSNKAADQYGDPNTTQSELCDMIAVVYGKKEVLGMTQEDLASVVLSSFPHLITLTDITKTEVKIISVNNDSYAVYTQEYKSTDYPLNPQDYYFSIGYTIESTYDKSCVDKCLC